MVDESSAIITPTPSPQLSPPPHPQAPSIDSGGTSPPLHGLTILKAVRSFSTERDQGRLLKRLLGLVLETAGATRGSLILQDSDGAWSVELSANIDTDLTLGDESESDTPYDPLPCQRRADRSAEPAGPSPPRYRVRAMSDPNVESECQGDGARMTDESSRQVNYSTRAVPSEPKAHPRSVSAALPQSVFSYVLNSVETLLLTDVERRSDATFCAFGSDPYFSAQGHDPKALLCMPVLRGGQVFGVLYLGQSASGHSHHAHSPSTTQVHASVQP